MCPVTMAAANESMAAESTASASQGSSRMVRQSRLRWKPKRPTFRSTRKCRKPMPPSWPGKLLQRMQQLCPRARRRRIFLHPAPAEAAAAEAAAAEAERPVEALSSPDPAPVSQPAYAMSAEISEYGAPLAARSNTPAPDSFVAAEPANVADLASASISQPEAAFVAPIPAELSSPELQPEPSSGFAEPTNEPVVESVNPALQTASAPPELPPAPESESTIVQTTSSDDAFAPIVHTEIHPEPVPYQKEEHQEEQKEEPETVDVKTTAAAWASWRQIPRHRPQTRTRRKPSTSGIRSTGSRRVRRNGRRCGRRTAYPGNCRPRQPKIPPTSPAS